MEKIIIKVDKKERLSKVLCDYGFSYSSVLKMLRLKDVRLNDEKCSKDCLVKPQDEIVVFYHSFPHKFKIAFEDENIYIVNKKAGIEVAGEKGLEGKIKNSIAVHRLDRNTQGLLVMAKNFDSRDALLKAFKNKEIDKKYLCEVVGKTNFSQTFSAYLKKDALKSKVEIFDKKVKDSVEIKTKLNTLKSNQTSVVEVELITGKTHQIRAHLAFLGHPILGDGKYGKNKDNKIYKEKSQKLFCFYLKFKNLDKPLQYLNNKEFTLYPDWYKK